MKKLQLRKVCASLFALTLAAGCSLWNSSAIAQSSTLLSHDLAVSVPQLPTAESASSECSIVNLQGTIASGTLSLFSVEGQGFATFFNPAGSGGPGDPGCFISEPYPFTISNVQLNMFAAGAFGIPAAEGVGTFQYVVKIWSAEEISAGCNGPGTLLYTSSTQSVTITTAANAYPQTVDVDFDVTGPFYAMVEAVSWSGAPTRSPSAVLWSGGGVPNCRQYLLFFNAESELVIADMNSLGFTTTGWANVTVNGKAAEQAGDVDIAVSNVTADPELTQSIPATVTATISNLGEVAMAGVSAVLTANGNTVMTVAVNLAAGASTVVDFIYTPTTLGEVVLTVTTNEANDIDPSNNSASTTVNVVAPADPCIFTDDFESYTLGGLVAQSPQWVTWTPNTPAQDAQVTDAQALSGTQSMVIAGNPQDVNFNLGNQTSGTWRVGFHFLVPAGNGAYWNIQKSQTPGVEWAMQMFMNSNGTGSVDAGGAGAATFNYTQGIWNEVVMVINLNSNIANLYLNGNILLQWPYSWSATAMANGLVQIGAINFFPAAVPSPLMYVDDVSFCQWENNGPCEAFTLLLNQVVVGDNTNATPYDTSLADDADCWVEATPTVDNDVWYTFTVPEDGSYMVTTNLEELTNDDTQIMVYTSSDDTCEGVLTPVGCGDDVSASNFLTEVILSDLTAGTVLWIMVDGWNGTAGTFQIAVTSLDPVAHNDCDDAADLNPLMGGALNVPQVSAVVSNVLATSEDAVGVPSCFDDEEIDRSLWFTFTGDGNVYYITTTDCGGGINYVPFGDTQIAIYTGGCNALTEVDCNEDIDFAGNNWVAGLPFATQAGVVYHMMVDTWGGGAGEFCVSFMNMGNTENTTSTDGFTWNLFPNPATDMVRIQSSEVFGNILILSSSGQLVRTLNASAATEVTFDVRGLAKGLYFVQTTIDGHIYTRKLTVH